MTGSALRCSFVKALSFVEKSPCTLGRMSKDSALALNNLYGSRLQELTRESGFGCLTN